METTRSLPPSVERKHIHSRHVESHGFLRADGLWDIEARIKDTKTYFTRNADGRERQPGEALHHIEHAGARDKWMGCGVRVLLGPLPGRRRRPG
jgi:hypothetical protein